MKINPITDFAFPTKLAEILAAEAYWETAYFSPIFITVEPISYNGVACISYQLEFEVLAAYPDTDGHQWEALIMTHLQTNAPHLVPLVKGDSEMETCVVWASDAAVFLELLDWVIMLLEKETSA